MTSTKGNDAMRILRTRRGATVPIALLSLTLVAATFSPASASTHRAASGGSVALGMSITLSGAVAELGQTGLQGVQLAVANLNAHGGLLGKTVTLVSADDAASPITGAANTRAMILNDHVVALIGPLISSVAISEMSLAAQYKIPIILHSSSAIQLLTKYYTKYAFRVGPDTVMEPRAIASYFARQVAGKTITIATIAPDYVFGHSSVDGFLQALTQLHVKYKLVAQQFPPLGVTNIAPYLSAIIVAKPDYLFNVQFGGDLVAFTRQAAPYGLFKNTKMIAMYSGPTLKALGADSPAGAIAFDRAAFWAENGAGMQAFITQYKAKYGDYPSEWAIMAYTAVESWAYAVKKAKSFTGDAVSDALSGATAPTIRGPLRFRACDHQANVPEYVGTVAATKDEKYGQVLWDPNVFVGRPYVTMLTCAQSLALRG